MMYNHPLNENSVIFDVGGYHGLFTDIMCNRYKCTSYIFEPIKEFFNIITEKFKDNERVNMFNFGLSSVNDSVYMYKNGDGTSIIPSTTLEKTTVDVVRMCDFLKEHKISNVDLINVNIECGEYALIPDMMYTNPSVFDMIMVQFHSVMNNAEQLRDIARDSMKHTHDMLWNFNFIYELWERRS